MYLSIDSVRADVVSVRFVRQSARSSRRLHALQDVQSATSLEEFMQFHGAERQHLALRRLSGKTLTAREMARLAVLDAQLDRLLPPPIRQPEKVTQAALEAERLIRKYGTSRAE